MIKQVFTRVVAVTLACGLAAACTSLRVTSDVNKSLAGSVQCHSFDWAGSFHGNSDLRSTVANPVNEARLRSAIQANLNAVGIHQTTENPDCLVGYGIGARNVVEGYWGPGWGWGAGYGWRHGGWGYYGAWGWDYPYTYQEGVIGVDVYDGKSKQGLWHASVNQNLVGVTGDKADKKIKDAVAAIFTKYPGA
jgi:hypothetical protein